MTVVDDAPGTAERPTYVLDQLDWLESEAIHIIREVVAEFEKPVLLFSGGKDSVVMLHLATKAFWPAPVPFPVLHVDTGHNFPEVLAYRDATVERLGLRLEVASVQDYIDDGRLRERADGTRNPLQTQPLLDAITDHRFDAVFGGGRRDEEKARAKERVFSLRDEFGQWDPRNQRPELWNLYNGRHRPGEHVRVFPLSNWTELDVWRYIGREQIALPELYYAHEREVFERDGMLLSVGEFAQPKDGEDVVTRQVRYRTVGDMSCTGAVESDATSVDDVIAEVAATRLTERGATRADDRISEAAMEDRKKEGYFLMSSLLRLATAGSVDDGKSTLVGRLLYDSKSVLADQFDAVERVSRDRGLETADLALLTDGLRSEREQGITIDVAYRYFATAERSFILADCPGHVQYTRNTVTGASTADVVVLLVDARKGLQEQTSRHLAVASLLRVPHVVVVVNKIDLLDYDQATYERVAAEVVTAAAALGLTDVTTIPVSALVGDNVVERSDRTPWYDGPSLLTFLETLSPAGEPHSEPLRFPVQLVIRPQSAADEQFRDYRGYAGQIASGLVRVGDPVTVLPSGRESTVAGIDTADGELTEAFAPQSVTLRLTDDVDVSRGDLLVTSRSVPPVTQDLEGTVAWLSEHRLVGRTKVLLKHGTRTVQAMVTEVKGRLDLDTATLTSADALELNDIGHVTLRLAAPIAAEEYLHARAGGSFLLVDAQDGTTLAAGMVGDALLATAAV